jgi:hypothetical protein
VFKSVIFLDPSDHFMKNHHHNGPIHPTIPTHEDITSRARSLWIEHGRPENCDDAIWLEAEKQLTAGKSKSLVRNNNA